jgi:hypothetical protein
VSSGAETEDFHAFDAKSELAFTKGAELFAESIPGED